MQPSGPIVQNRFMRLLAALAICAGIAASPAAARNTPDFGLQFNDDGDSLFQVPDGATLAAKLQEDMKFVVRAGVKTINYGMTAGVAYFPSKVESALGWRPMPGNVESRWPTVTNARALFAAGVDPLKIAARAFKSAGGSYFLLSHRISDSHFMGAPEHTPLTTKFWYDNPKFRIGAARTPLDGQREYGNLLDFSHAEVRKHHLDLLSEAVQRYAGDIDGIQIDFMRVPVLFPKGGNAAGLSLMTGFVADVRAMLDRESRRSGRKLYLFVRVPPTLANARWAGLDVAGWMKAGLVDVVSPSQLMTIAPDMPVAQFVEAAHGTRIYPSIPSRRYMGWSFSGNPDADLRNAENAQPDNAYVAGAAANYFGQGADGVELFNWAARSWLRAEWFQVMGKNLSEGSSKPKAAAVYDIPHAYYIDHLGAFEPRKQLPLRLAGNASNRLNLSVGPGADCRKSQCLLRVGLGDAPKDGTLAVAINGQQLKTLPMTEARPTPLKDKKAGRQGFRTPAPAYFFYIPVTEAAFRPGSNSVEITTSKPTIVNAVSLRVLAR